MLLLNSRPALAIALCAAACSQPILPQVAPPTTIISVDVDNYLTYLFDTIDPTRLATISTVTTAAAVNNFRINMAIGDVVAVNGKPAKGTLTVRATGLIRSPTPSPGQAIADVVRGGIADRYYEFLDVAGTPIGTLMLSGQGGGDNPPGALLGPPGAGNFAITGGTRAFLR